MMERESDRKLQMEQVCSLCGDVGFKNALLLCSKCGNRLQHTYCSRFYPKIDMERWCCEWCIHEEEEDRKKASTKRRRSKVFEFLLEIAESFPENEEKRVCRKEEEERLPTEEKRSEATTREKVGLKKNVRCLEKNNKALDRWRNLAKTKFGCRRYKLLADVHC